MEGNLSATAVIMLATMQKETMQAKKSLRILYADDMQELRDMVQITLSRAGHTVECAVDGSSALQRVSADPSAFDLIITDHQMPNMTGLELVTQLRALPFLGKIFLFSSGLSDELCEAYHRLKIDNILHKPIFPYELRQALEQI